MMTLFNTHRISIALTCGVFICALSFREYWFLLLSMVAITGIWVRELYSNHEDTEKHAVVVERVNQLKSFSIELQALVNKELALVQDDVLRIRGVVVDSIGILQEGVESINAQIVICQNKQPVNDSSNNQDKKAPIDNTALNSVMNKMQEMLSSVKSLEDISLQTQLLAKNTSIDTAQMTGGGSVVTQMADNASSVVRSSSTLESGVQQCIDTISNAMEVIDQSSINDAQYANEYQLIQRNIDDIRRALQFEDIVSQISERVAQHIGDIRFTVDILSKLCESELSDTFDEDLEMMKSELTGIRKKLSNISAKKIVAQHNMDEGDIDLF